MRLRPDFITGVKMENNVLTPLAQGDASGYIAK
jgi:hypothetical protein